MFKSTTFMISDFDASDSGISNSLGSLGMIRSSGNSMIQYPESLAFQARSLTFSLFEIY